ncbi:MAG: carboxylating nicotinate-nucleotide diphosphorylase [Gammaproteobacteria bacterium]|nr:carboxylating nicotinate-nucleotide diphosphorylase [Gammaproteobacteria bacterium]
MSCALPPAERIAEDVARALAEDLGAGDLTAGLIPAERQSQVEVISRQSAVICGQAWFEQAFWQIDPQIQIHWQLADGAQAEPDQLLCRLQGNTRALLSGERTALNFLQTLSATASQVARYVQRLEGCNSRVLDTRKTLPGLRLAQKYAVCCGGGSNHRFGLYDAVLIKENHILAAGSIAAALQAAQAQVAAGTEIEIEVESLDELQQALDAGARRVLLDNFSLEQLRQAVSRNAQRGTGRARLEASGNVSLESIRAIAETGVDDISIGALTKDIKAVDLSMRFVG